MNTRLAPEVKIYVDDGVVITKRATSFINGLLAGLPVDMVGGGPWTVRLGVDVADHYSELCAFTNDRDEYLLAGVVLARRYAAKGSLESLKPIHYNDLLAIPGFFVDGVKSETITLTPNEAVNKLARAIINKLTVKRPELNHVVKSIDDAIEWLETDVDTHCDVSSGLAIRHLKAARTCLSLTKKEDL